MTKHSLDEILSDFNPNEQGASIDGGAYVTLWIPKDAKARYEKIQEMSKKRFSKKASAALVALIDVAFAKVS